MQIIIGGYAQGKYEYVRNEVRKQDAPIALAWNESEGTLAQLQENLKQTKGVVLINHYHLILRQEMKEWENRGLALESFAKEVLPKWEENLLAWERVSEENQLWLLSDEVGNGVVPLDAFERIYREETGRSLTRLAASACRVERIFCGIPQRLK